MDDQKLIEEAQEVYLEEYARNGNLRKAFTIALDVTRKVITEEQDAQWEKAILDVARESRWSGWITFIDEVRARLAEPSAPTDRERVEAILLRHISPEGRLLTLQTVAAEI